MRGLVKTGQHLTNGLALVSGSDLPREGRQELVSCPHTAHVEPHVLVIFEHLLEFVLPKKPVVDEDAVQAIADRPVEEFSRHRRVHVAQP